MLYQSVLSLLLCRLWLLRFDYSPNAVVVTMSAVVAVAIAIIATVMLTLP